MKLNAPALSLALLACSAPSQPAAVAVPAASAAPSAAALAAAPPSPADALALKAQAAHAARVETALSHIPDIEKAVATIRQLPLKHEVPASEQSQADFRRFLDGEVKKEMPPDKSAATVRALVRLGFLKEPLDLGKTVEEAMLSQAGAYYDPETKRFYLVLVPDDEQMLDVMSAHELTHAVDDQYFDLARYEDDARLSNDAALARHLVAEGEATLVMLAYEAKVAAHKDIFEPANRPTEQAMVATFAAMDSESLAKAAAQNPDMLRQMGPDMKASIDAMSSIPPFILDPLFGAYTKGCAAVAAVRDAGGWDAVSRLYTSPPESTEQLLHTADKLIAHRDRPVDLTLAPRTGALAALVPIDEDVIGELTMAVYFKLWGDKSPAAEVTGWGGDRYAAFDDSGKTIAVWLTTWDTVADAERFAHAYAGTLPIRFAVEGAPTRGRTPRQGDFTHPDGTATAWKLTGKDVLILDGVPANLQKPMLDWLGKTTHSRAK